MIGMEIKGAAATVDSCGFKTGDAMREGGFTTNGTAIGILPVAGESCDPGCNRGGKLAGGSAAAAAEARELEGGFKAGFGDGMLDDLNDSATVLAFPSASSMGSCSCAKETL